MRFFYIVAGLFVGTVSLAQVTPSPMGNKKMQNSFYVSPGLAYTSGVLTQKNSADIEVMAPRLEIRTGYNYNNWDFGGSYFYGVGTSKQYGQSDDYKPIDLGLHVAYNLPLKTKIFLGYLFNSTVKIDSSNNTDNFSGTGTRFGLAYTGWVGSIEIELIRREYDKYSGTSMTNPLKDSSIALSFNYPFKF